MAAYRAHVEPVDVPCAAAAAENVQVVNMYNDDNRWLRKPLVTRVSTSTTMAKTQFAAARPGVGGLGGRGCAVEK